MRSTHVVLVVALALAGTARAQPDDVVQTFQDGVDAFRLGKYAEARVLLEKARAKDPKLPGPHRFLAAVAQAEKRWDDCIASARQAIALKPDSAEVEATRTIHDACRAGLGKPAFTGDYAGGGAISVTANIEGATVTLGGLRYGATPLLPRSLAVGTVDIKVEKLGWLPATATAEILPSIVTDVNVTLEPDPQAGLEVKPPTVDPTTHGWLVLCDGEAGASGQMPGRPGVCARALGAEPLAAGATVKIDGAPVAIEDKIPITGGVHEVLVEAEGRERWRRRVRITRGQKAVVAVDLPTYVDRAGKRRKALYVLAGSGALAVLGMSAALLSDRAAEEARDIWQVETSRPPGVPIGQTEGVEPLRTRDDLESARDRAKTWSYVSLAAYGVAIVGAGLGGYMLIRARSGDVEGQPAPFAIAPTPDGVVVAGTVQW